MAGFKLLPPDGTCTYSKIVRGRKWVGRVYPRGDGGYGGKIGSHESRATTRIEAFERVAALALGYSSPEEVRRNNARIRAERRAQSRIARAYATRFARGDLKEKIAVIDELFDMFDKSEKEGMTS